MTSDTRDSRQSRESSLFTEYLCCPFCGGDIDCGEGILTCRDCAEQFKVVNGVPRMVPVAAGKDTISTAKWDAFYAEQLESASYREKYRLNKELYFQSTYDQLVSEKTLGDAVYLEVGCGTFLMGQEIADECRVVIGVDYSEGALAITRQMLEERGIDNYLLVHGDITHLPIKSNTVDLIYGGGVIEHFECSDETQTAVNEMFRVLKRNGVSFNTVPLLNLSVVYRQVWGNIPNVPVLKQLAEFVHVKVLSGKHMIFGRELSFTSRSLRKIHHRAGFREVRIDKFETGLKFEYAPRFARKPLSKIANSSRLFWPMVKAVAKK